MWTSLPQKDKTEYKKMILAFASLTEMFAQKAGGNTGPLIPVINSKYQEKVFQIAFGAHGEDKNNTSYDASLETPKKKYVIGIKTFGYSTSSQKVAQFKANEKEWIDDISLLRKNKYSENGSERTLEEINTANKDIYLRIARRLAQLRNMRIKSSIENLEGFNTSDLDTSDIESVYHVLMPRLENNLPRISVGETSYDLIDLENLESLGCLRQDKPDNFAFTDGKHIYRFTPADSQLLMNFKNSEIVLETWDVKYADDAYAIFSGIAETLYKEEPAESYCWHITNEKGEVEKFSGFNGFYGTGSKLQAKQREERINRFNKKFCSITDLKYFSNSLRTYLLEKADSQTKKEQKAVLRNQIMEKAKATKNTELILELKKLLYRPVNEMYIPLPNSKKFHTMHPIFFINEGLKLNPDGSFPQSTAERSFNLVFDPSGDKLTAYIAEQNGKAIESAESMGKLGEWILRKVFQLGEFEPLTAQRLNEVGINGIRLEKHPDGIHLSFIWIPSDEPLPSDYWH